MRIAPGLIFWEARLSSKSWAKLSVMSTSGTHWAHYPSPFSCTGKGLLIRTARPARRH
jgi:hypothetical protein